MLASSFSAMRCAVVAPTLPAPTTVILLTIVGLYDFVSVRRKLSGPHTRSNRARRLLSRQSETALAIHPHASAAGCARAVWSTTRSGRMVRAEFPRAADRANRLRLPRKGMCADDHRP